MDKIDLLLLSLKYYEPGEVKRYGYCMPPLNLIGISSYLKNFGYKCKVIDLQYFKGDISKFVKKVKCNNVGLSVMTPQVNEAKKISKMVKEVDRDIVVIWGGAHPNVLPRECVEIEGVDIVVYGEGEETLLEILNKKKLDTIKGIAYRHNGKAIINPPRPFIKDIDRLSWPEIKRKDFGKYHNLIFGKKAIILRTTRGCPYNCIFCSNKYKNNVRFKSVKNVVDRIEDLIKKFNCKYFEFHDETFTLNRKRTINLCKEIIKRKLDIKWYCNTRCDKIDKELLILMKKAGCTQITYGIESGDEDVLRIINKRMNLSQIIKVVNLTKEVGIEVWGTFIIGLPYENHKTIRKTINLAKDLPLDFATFQVATPLPGTKMWEMAKNSKGIKLVSDDYNKIKFDGREPIVRLPHLTQRNLKEYYIKAYKEFYYRPNFIIKKLLGSPLDIVRFIRMGIDLNKMISF